MNYPDKLKKNLITSYDEVQLITNEKNLSSTTSDASI